MNGPIPPTRKEETNNPERGASQEEARGCVPWLWSPGPRAGAAGRHHRGASAGSAAGRIKLGGKRAVGVSLGEWDKGRDNDGPGRRRGTALPGIPPMSPKSWGGGGGGKKQPLTPGQL